MNNVNLGLNLQLNVLLELLLDTTKQYMEAFQLDPNEIDMSITMMEKYKAFRQVSAYYMNAQNKCVSYVIFNFDWNTYSLKYDTKDPDVLETRRQAQFATPANILREACNVIQNRVNAIKDKRNVTSIKMLFQYSDEVLKNSNLLEKVRTEAGLQPFTGKIEYSNEMNGLKTNIVPSITEDILSMDFTI